jgi:hypothetical protein
MRHFSAADQCLTVFPNCHENTLLPEAHPVAASISCPFSHHLDRGWLFLNLNSFVS